MDLGLLQKEVAAIVRVGSLTITNWELGQTMPEIQYYPAIFEFLGYDPFPDPESFREKLLWLRRRLGLRQRELGNRLGVSAYVIWSWEAGRQQPAHELRDRFGKMVEEARRSPPWARQTR